MSLSGGVVTCLAAGTTVACDCSCAQLNVPIEMNNPTTSTRGQRNSICFLVTRTAWFLCCVFRIITGDHEMRSVEPCISYSRNCTWLMGAQALNNLCFSLVEKPVSGKGLPDSGRY
jgi:hypothetical protein